MMSYIKTTKLPKKTVVISRDNPEIRSLQNEVNKEDVLKKEFKKMESFMLIGSEALSNSIQSKLEDWDEKLYGNKKNKATIDDELEYRKSQRELRKKKKYRDDFYISQLQPRDPEKNIRIRLENNIQGNQMERDDIMELYNKISKSYKNRENIEISKKEYKFPQNDNISKKVIIKEIERNQENENQYYEMNPNQTPRSGSSRIIQDSEFRFKKNSFSQVQKQNSDYFYEEEEEEDDDSDEDDNDDDYEKTSGMDVDYLTERSLRSNFDKASVFSKSRSQIEKEWEYNSLKEYNITDIPKLTEEIDTQTFKPQQPEKQKEGSQMDIDKTKDNDEIKEGRENKETGKNKQKNKKRILNIKQEKSYEEFLTLNIHEKIQYTAQVDHIQKISFGYTPGSVIHPDNQVQYYRDMTSQSRDLLGIDNDYRGTYYEGERQQLLEIDDIYIDLNNVTFQDITNIVSDRVPYHLIENYTNPKFVVENFNKFSYVPEKSSNQVVDKLTYTQSLHDVKKSQYVEMKSYYQKMKTWQDKDFQVSHKDIVSETKSVTDWLMEDLYHIRKATISSYDLDFHPKINKVLQTQLYHKFEQKLLLLLQIILYRENIPQWKIPRDIFGRPELTEEEQKIQRMKVDKLREEDEQRFFKLFTTEQQLVQDLKKLLRDVNQISSKGVDGRSKTELLRIFLVDYNEIVKYKSEQLNRIKQIDEELGEINMNFSQIEGKSLYERLYEAKIGHIKNQVTDELSDVQVLSMLSNKRTQLQKERQSILLNSAQIFPISEEQIQELSQGKNSNGSSPRLSPTKTQSENLAVSRLKQSANKQLKQNSSKDNRKDKNGDDYKQNQIDYQQVSKEDLYIPLDQTNASNRTSRTGLTPQKQPQQSAQKLQRSNTAISQRNQGGLMTPISTTKSRNVSELGTTSNNRSLHKSSTQKSLFSQYKQQSTIVDFSPRDFDFDDNSPENRGDSRLTNRQIMNATPTQENYEDRERLDEPQRGTPDKFQRKQNHSKTTYVIDSQSKENEIKQIKLFQQARNQENNDRLALKLHKSPVVSEFDQTSKSNLNQSRSKSPMLSKSPSQLSQFGLNQSQKSADNEFVRTKMDRMKQRQPSNNNLMNSSQILTTPLKQSSINQNNSAHINSANSKSFSVNKQAPSSVSNIQQKDWKQVFQAAKHRTQFSNKK